MQQLGKEGLRAGHTTVELTRLIFVRERMTDDLFGMTDAEHVQWLRDQGTDILDLSEPSEENLCRLVSDALRSVDKADRAQTFIDIANMSLALADKTLGAQGIMSQCLVLQRH